MLIITQFDSPRAYMCDLRQGCQGFWPGSESVFHELRSACGLSVSGQERANHNREPQRRQKRASMAWPSAAQLGQVWPETGGGAPPRESSAVTMPVGTAMIP